MKLALILITVPLFAELHTLRVEYESSGCSSCVESLQGRLKRMRGVEEVKAEGDSAVEMKLATGNRVRLEIVRDFIEQGAGKVKKMTLEASGSVVQDAGATYFELSGVGARYRLDGPGKDGRIRAVITDTKQLIWKPVE